MLNRIQLSVVCRSVGTAVGLSINWQDAAYRLVIPAQLYKYHLPSIDAASGKLV